MTRNKYNLRVAHCFQCENILTDHGTSTILENNLARNWIKIRLKNQVIDQKAQLHCVYFTTK